MDAIASTSLAQTSRKGGENNIGITPADLESVSACARRAARGWHLPRMQRRACCESRQSGPIPATSAA
jgi:hypothetical protein